MDIGSWQECALECKKHNKRMTEANRLTEACEYFQWNGSDPKRSRKDKRRYEENLCILKNQDHCGFYGSSCKQTTVKGVYSGSVKSCIHQGEI